MTNTTNPTADDLRQTTNITGATHLADEDGLLCGNPTATRKLRLDSERMGLDDVDAPLRECECKTCLSVLLSRGYEAPNAGWNTVRDLDGNDVVRVEREGGEPVTAVVTREEDAEPGDYLPSARVTIDATPETYGIATEGEDDERYALYARETGDGIDLETVDTWADLDADLPEWDVTSVEVIGTYDPVEWADEDRAARDDLIDALAEVVDAEEETYADAKGDDRLAYLYHLNRQTPASDAKYRLASEGHPVEWVREKAEDKLNHLAPSDTLDDDEDAAKRRGTIEGWECVLDLIDDYDEAAEDDNEDDDTDAATVSTDGGHDVDVNQMSDDGDTRSPLRALAQDHNVEEGDALRFEYVNMRSKTTTEYDATVEEYTGAKTCGALLLDDGRTFNVRGTAVYGKNDRRIGYLRWLDAAAPETTTRTCRASECDEAARTRSSYCSTGCYEDDRGTTPSDILDPTAEPMTDGGREPDDEMDVTEMIADARLRRLAAWKADSDEDVSPDDVDADAEAEAVVDSVRHAIDVDEMAAAMDAEPGTPAYDAEVEQIADSVQSLLDPSYPRDAAYIREACRAYLRKMAEDDDTDDVDRGDGVETDGCGIDVLPPNVIRKYRHLRGAYRADSAGEWLSIDLRVEEVTLAHPGPAHEATAKCDITSGWGSWAHLTWLANDVLRVLVVADDGSVKSGQMVDLAPDRDRDGDGDASDGDDGVIMTDGGEDVDDDIVLPEGVSRGDVEVDTEVEAYVLHGTESNPRDYDRPFNPKNGRYYEEVDPGHASYDSTNVVGGLRVNCAYDDCTGWTNIIVEGSIDDSCPECGESMMGRHQFSSTQRRTRETRRAIESRVASYADEFSQEMARVTDAGVGPAAAVDFLMCSVGDVPYEEWAKARDVSPRAVKRNMKRVATALGETVSYSSRGWE